MHQTNVMRCETIDIFLWIDAVDDLCLVDMFRQWQLDDVSVDLFVVVKKIDEFEKLFLRGVLREAID